MKLKSNPLRSIIMDALMSPLSEFDWNFTHLELAPSSCTRLSDLRSRPRRVPGLSFSSVTTGSVALQIVKLDASVS